MSGWAAFRRQGTCAAALALAAAWGVALGGVAVADDPAPPDVFMQVWETVDEGFFDPEFNGVDWPAMRERYAAEAAAAESREARAAVINAMLAELDASHTRLYTPDEPAYYQLLGIFASYLREKLEAVGASPSACYAGIGIFTEEVDGRLFVSAVLDGGPASAAGLLAGDELLAADGAPFHPIRSFERKADQPVTVTIRRAGESDAPMEVAVTPRMLDGETMFVDAMRESIGVVERDGARVGYVHAWSYAGREYQEILEGAMLYGGLRDADALVLDVREGWGGASPTYLNIFTERTITMTGEGPDGAATRTESGWSKPVVLLVNGRTRSGKELLAYGFKALDIGPVVGSRTAGAYLAGSPYVMADGGMLYLAVAGGGALDDGVVLEGVGVTPDIEVPFALPYAQGADPQKERAIALAAELAAERG